ncbi:MAG: hypothetical protein R3344_08310 [Acidobacteriota bacterium]|nr:hypothetical protein [Acidobacteriota bacterium]
MTRARDRWIAGFLALVGLSVCVVGLAGFVWTISSNNLPWYPGMSARDYYLEIGKFYSVGFATGFFLCFFLLLLSAVARGWYRSRRGDVASAPVGTTS